MLFNFKFSYYISIKISFSLYLILIKCLCFFLISLLYYLDIIYIHRFIFNVANIFLQTWRTINNSSSNNNSNIRSKYQSHRAHQRRPIDLFTSDIPLFWRLEMYLLWKRNRGAVMASLVNRTHLIINILIN